MTAGLALGCSLLRLKPFKAMHNLPTLCPQASADHTLVHRSRNAPTPQQQIGHAATCYVTPRRRPEFIPLTS